MPVQKLNRAPQTTNVVANSLKTWIARFLVCFILAGLTGYGIFEMVGVVGYRNMTIAQGVMVVLFSLTFGWISLAAASALTGMLTPLSRFQKSVSLSGCRTVLLMPIHNENQARVTASLQAMAEGLGSEGVAGVFEIAVISDSTNIETWVAETMAVNHLRAALSGIMPVWYRRRWHNIGGKAGNIEEFVKRWGGRYDYMVVLDADSLMSPAVVITLIQRMEGDRMLGLLQTAPRPISQLSLFARLQQFSGWVYGVLIARGISAWAGNDSNYWGHNAAIRTAAFAGACGLPVLPGEKPLGGHVLSHDFVEAALMRRAGWKVRMAVDLKDSWEESPPSLAEAAARDRRWAQGNLQHVKVVGARGLSFFSRIHFFVGIMSYLSSPIWMLLILTGFALTLQAEFTKPRYFGNDHQLFPHWPYFDVRRMSELFIISMIVLLTPKILGVLRSLCSATTRKEGGGILGLLAGSFIETVLSALYAPILMLIQTKGVIQILLGKDSGWNAQRRLASGVLWREALGDHWTHTLIGMVAAFLAYQLSPSFLWWVSPVLLSLVMSIPLAKASGSIRLGRILKRWAILQTPEESHIPEIVRHRDEIEQTVIGAPENGLLFLVRNPQARHEHIAGNLQPPPEPRGYPEADRLMSERKVKEAHTLREALSWLTPAERLYVAADLHLLDSLAALPEE